MQSQKALHQLNKQLLKKQLLKVQTAVKLPLKRLIQIKVVQQMAEAILLKIQEQIKWKLTIHHHCLLQK